jgi:hypothetical protein
MKIFTCSIPRGFTNNNYLRMQIFPAIVGDHKDRRKENIPHLSQVFFGGAHSETFSEKKKPLTHLSGEGMVGGRIAAPPILLLDYVKLRISPLFS